MNIKQLLCEHIWKVEKEEYLRTTRIFWFSTRLPIYEVDKYASHAICIKCGKKCIKEIEGKRDYTV